jgi:hypothetical protein
VSYRRVREWDIDGFRLDYRVSSKRTISQSDLCHSQNAGFVLPDLPDVWKYLETLPTLGDISEIGEGLSYCSKLPKGTIRWSEHSFPGAAKGFIRLGRSLQTHSQPVEFWLNLSPDILSPSRLGADRLPQILLNHARAGRGPWRIKAFIDREGHAFTNNYNAVRPKKGMTLEFLWAVLNSPLANAYAFAHATSRHNLPGTLQRMPVPAVTDQLMEEITGLVAEYHRIAKANDRTSSRSTLSRLRFIAIRLDALVLKAYDLTPQLERQLLDLFAGHQRVGVPYTFDKYFPDDFQPWLHLYEYLSDEFRNSQAGAIIASHRTFNEPEVSEALRRATEDFEEDG